MPPTVVDSNVLIAAANGLDQNHERGLAIVRGIDAGDLPTNHVTNYVIAEVLNMLHSKHTQQHALDHYGRLNESAGFEIIHCARKDYTRGLVFFERYEGLSFVDATIAAYMERRELEFLYSFDDDFDAFQHITRLETPNNPFH